MRKINRLTFNELIEKNKEELLSDQKALDKLKERLDEKIEEKLAKTSKSYV